MTDFLGLLALGIVVVLSIVLFGAVGVVIGIVVVMRGRLDDGE